MNLAYDIDTLASEIVNKYGAETVRGVIIPDDPYQNFRRRYRDNYVGFVHDCIIWEPDAGPTFYQEEILAEIPGKKRVSIRGPHGLGKTTLAAWVILCFALTRDGEDWKCPTTASVSRQLEKYLWPEVHKWARKLNWEKIGREPFTRNELLVLNLKMNTGAAFAVSSDNPYLIEGAHADELCYIFDESKTISDETFDAAEGAFAGAGKDTNVNAYALAMSTPGPPSGRFYDIHTRKLGFEDWWVKHVSLEDAIKAGRMSKEWADKRKRQWGEDSALYQNRVLGEFAADSADTVIPIAWVELANRRWEDWQEEKNLGNSTSVGVDIGGGGPGANKSVLAIVYDKHKVDKLRKYDRGDPETATMEITGRVKGILDKAKEATAFPDVIGIGLGVYHRLNEIKRELEADGKTVLWNVYPFNSSASKDIAHLTDESGELGFFNKRSAGWWRMREMLDPDNEVEVALPPDNDLTGDLTSPRASTRSGGKIYVESKKDIMKRLKRSTDSADAVIYGLTGPELCVPKSKWRKSKFLSV